MTRWAANVTVDALKRDLIQSIARELSTLHALRGLLEALGKDDRPRAEGIASAKHYLAVAEGRRPPLVRDLRGADEIQAHLCRMAGEAWDAAHGSPGAIGSRGVFEEAIAERMAQATFAIVADRHSIAHEAAKAATEAAALRVAQLPLSVFKIHDDGSTAGFVDTTAAIRAAAGT